MYVIGKTWTGKSTLLETLALQDIGKGGGMMLIDPHGDLADRVMRAVPAYRRRDVIYFNVPDTKQRFGYNPLKHVREDKISLAASGLGGSWKLSRRCGRTHGASAWSTSTQYAVDIPRAAGGDAWRHPSHLRR